MSSDIRLILGTPNQSSWSMRAFLCASPLINALTIDWRTFDQNDRLTDSKDCPTAQVPVLYLRNDPSAIVETFAIAETLAELGGLQWPDASTQRSTARSLCLEFQSNSSALRKAVPMDLSRNAQRLDPHPDLIFWTERLNQLLEQSNGEFLFGDLSIADAWFSPVVARAVRCDLIKSMELQQYLESLRTTQGWRQWMKHVGDAGHDYVS